MSHNPNDNIRRQMLGWFYDRNANATSQYGKKGSAAKISDVKRGLREKYDLGQQAVMSNLTYLIDKGWINKSEIEKTVRVRGGTVPSTVTWYEISATGIDRIEGESEFKTGGRYAGINVNAIGTNVIAVGDGNIVNAHFAALHNELSKLKKEVASSALPDAQKLEIAVDIESLNNQLVKAAPDKTIVGRIWHRIEQVATAGGFVDAIQKVLPLISGLLPT